MSSIPKTQLIGYSSNQHYGPASPVLQRYSSLDYISMLLEKSEKLYDKLDKEGQMKLFLIMLPTYHHHYYPRYHHLKSDRVIQQQQLIRPICIQKNIDLVNQKQVTTAKMEANILLWIEGNLTVPLSLSTLLFCFAIIIIVM